MHIVFIDGLVLCTLLARFSKTLGYISSGVTLHKRKDWLSKFPYSKAAMYSTCKQEMHCIKNQYFCRLQKEISNKISSKNKNRYQGCNINSK